jgi:hypothetical protein
MRHLVLRVVRGPIVNEGLGDFLALRAGTSASETIDDHLRTETLPAHGFSSMFHPPNSNSTAGLVLGKGSNWHSTD